MPKSVALVFRVTIKNEQDVGTSFMAGSEQTSGEDQRGNEKKEAKDEVLKTLNSARNALNNEEWSELLNLTCLTVQQ